MAQRLTVRTVVVAILLAVGLGPAVAEPLRLGDVVQLQVAGKSADEIVRTIRESEVDFDLSSDMLDELRLAGVSETVISAMQERQLELHPPAAPPPQVEQPTGPPPVRIEFRDVDGEPTAALPVPAELTPAMAERLGLDPADEPRLEGVGVYIACLTATHVPHQWRNASPLGRDFDTMPRHRMLVFLKAAQSVEQDGVVETWILEFPELLEAPVESGPGDHDLLVGLAVGLDERYLRWGDTFLPGWSADSGPERLRVRVIRGDKPGLGTLELRFDPGPAPEIDEP